MQNILIIGASGFLGRHLIERFEEDKDCRLFGIGLDDFQHPRLDKYFTGDILQQEFIQYCLAQIKPNVIYYLATTFRFNNAWDFASIIARGILQLNTLFAGAADSEGVRIVYTGSSAEYGAVPLKQQPVKETTPLYPISRYGMYKAAEELEAFRLSHQYQVDLCRARIFNVTGPGEPKRMVGGAFVSQIAENRDNPDFTLFVGNLFPKRDFLDVRDAANAVKIIGLRGKAGIVYNVCSACSISIESYLGMIIEEIGFKPKIQLDPSRVNPFEIADLVGDNTLLRESLNWKPSYNIKNTIKDLVSFYFN